jgi:hypothetical protein
MKRLVKALLLVIVTGACLSGGITSAADVDFTYQGSALWGHMQDAVIDGKHLFCAMDHGLMILDITDPGSPSAVSMYPFLEGNTGTIAVSGNYAYVGLDSRVLMIMDISDVTSPQPVGQFPVDNYVVSMDFSGSTAYLCDESHGVRIVDFSDPANPVEQGFFSTEISYGREMCSVQGGYLYVASWWHFWILDVSDPANPQQVGYYYAPDRCQDMVIDDSLAYLADEDAGLIILNIADPTAPAEVSRWGIESTWVESIAKQGDIIYSGRGSSQSGYVLDLVDVSDPTQPTASGQVPAVGYMLRHGDEMLLTSDPYNAFQLFDVSDPNSPQALSSASIAYYGYTGYGQEIVSDGDFVYVAGGNMGLVILDITDPTAPAIVSQGVNPNRCFDLKLRERYLYLADEGEYYSEGLKVVDISNPGEPAIVGSLRLSSCTKIIIHDNLAFMGGNAPTNYIVDISDPFHPETIGSTYIPGITRGFASHGNYLYMSYDFGIVIVDISDVSEPVILDTLATGDQFGELLLYKGYLLAAMQTGLLVFDIATDPVSPTQVAYCPCRAEDIKPYGNYLFVANYQGVSVIDMTDPVNPTVIATQSMASGAATVAPFFDGVAAYDPNGLTLFQVSMPACCLVPGDATYDQTTNLADVVYLINFIFKGGPPLPCPQSGDANSDCDLNIGDAVYLIEYIFKGGEAPVCTDCP